MFRRKSLPAELVPAHQAFNDQVDRLVAARRALLSCLPVGRVEPAPVEVGLDLLDDVIGELQDELPAWRTPPLEEAWQLCADALELSRTKIPVAKRVAEETGELEELLGAVEDVDEPLSHAFGQAEKRFRALRR